MFKNVFQAGGEFYHENYVDLHFRNSASLRYGYRPRSGEPGSKNPPGSKYYKRTYTWRKLKKFGHTRPLEWTGESRALANVRDVRSTSKWARIYSHARVLNFKPWLFEELSRVIPQEAEAVAARMGREMEEQVGQFRSFGRYSI